MLSGPNSEDTLVQLSACHLQEKAAVWITRVEATTGMPQNLDDLKDAIMQKFVPNNEKARAISKLGSLKMTGSMDNHISDFLDLIDLAEAMDKESYNYLFNRLNGKHKKEVICEYSSE